MATDKGTRGSLLQHEIEISDVDSPYTVPSEGDTLLNVDCSSGPVVIELPALSNTTDTNRVTVIDSEHSASTNNITINPNGSDTVENDTEVIIAGNGTTLTFRGDLTQSDWKII